MCSVIICFSHSFFAPFAFFVVSPLLSLVGVQMFQSGKPPISTLAVLFSPTQPTARGCWHWRHLLRDDGLLAAEATQEPADPLAPRLAHFAPKAKACIYIYLEGAPSQIDLFDPKPKLNELNGQPLPESMTKNVRFAFLQKETARLMGCPRTFTKHGESGMELSDFLPHLATCADDMCLIRSMHTEAFNHHPGQLLLNTGSQLFGRPSMGAWLNYGLGSESKNLPGFVVLTAGRGTSGGTSNWSSGFLPTTYQGVLFRNQGEPVLNLNNPDGVSDEMQRRSIAGLTDLNRQRLAAIGDPEIATRIASYELAYPDANIGTGTDRSVGRNAGHAGDVRPRTRHTRKSRPLAAAARGQFEAFSRNCLLARRLVERGVRFVNIVHASWDHHSNLDVELAAELPDGRSADRRACSKTSSSAACSTRRWSSGPRNSAARRWAKTAPGFPAVTGRDHHPFAFSLWWPAAASKGDRSSARPTTSAGESSKTRSTSTTCRRRCWPCSASTT